MATKEKFQLPDDVSSQISRESNGNIRKAILMLEAMKMQSPTLDEGIEVAKPDWLLYSQNIAKEIVKKPSPENLLNVRGKLFELMTHCIPPTLILKVCNRCDLVEFLIKYESLDYS